jgi:hypothetical protein
MAYSVNFDLDIPSHPPPGVSPSGVSGPSQFFYLSYHSTLVFQFALF